MGPLAFSPDDIDVNSRSRLLFNYQLAKVPISVRDELFRYYVDLGNSLHYDRAYYISSRRISSAYSGFLFLASAGGIVTLSIWDSIPVVWAIIAVLAQIFQVLQPLTQASKQRNALKYIIQDKSDLFDEVCTYWNDVGAYKLKAKQRKDVRAKISEWKRREQNIYDRFAGDIDFPAKPWLEEKAKVANRRYFWYNYDVDIKEELENA